MLDETLKSATGRKGDARGEIYAYLQGRQIAYKVRAFDIGEALRACGVWWASGALALFAAGHLAEFVYALADLDRHGSTVDAAIMALRAAEALDGIEDARDMLATIIRPERYDEGVCGAPRSMLPFALLQPSRASHGASRLRFANLTCFRSAVDGTPQAGPMER